MKCANSEEMVLKLYIKGAGTTIVHSPTPPHISCMGLCMAMDGLIYNYFQDMSPPCIDDKFGWPSACVSLQGKLTPEQKRCRRRVR